LPNLLKPIIQEGLKLKAYLMNWIYNTITAFKIRDLRKKILFVLFILGVFRVAAIIPIPGVNPAQLEAFFSSSQFLGILNIFSGGALSNLSIVMLGLGPYITSTIILQLFTLIFPRLKELYEESGEEGKKKFNQYGRLLTVPLAALQGYGLMILFSRQGVLILGSPFEQMAMLVSIVAGAIFLMWLGELISEKGIGNGISLLIFTGIIASIPLSIQRAILTGTLSDIPMYLAFILISLFIIITVVFINEARRNIPISYAKRVRGNRLFGGSTTFLPLSLIPAGVIPIIFALSLVLFPGIVANFLAGTTSATLQSISSILNAFTENIVLFSSLYFLLVVGFTYFYTAIVFNPANVAKNLQRNGGFIPGIRPGPPTAARISFILNRTILVGAIFLGIIAIIPSVAQGSGLGGTTGSTSFIIGGTSVLIAISVILETIRQIKAQIVMRQYD